MSETKTSRVKTQNLKPGMTIIAYSGFHPKYHSLNEKSCRFLQHNFKKSKASVIRNHEKREIPVELLKPADRLLRLYAFPPELKKLLTVNEKLINALKARGFMEFDVTHEALEKDEQKELQDAISLVKQASMSTKEKEEHYKKAKEKAEKFVYELKANITTRSNTSKAIENIMDDARKGKVSYSGINEYVDEITRNSSAEAISAIVSLKQSDQTYDHCVDVGVIFQSSYFKIIEKFRKKGIFETQNKALLAAFLHDFGKSKIPKDILDSTVRFERESEEMKLMESHPEFGAEILSGMDMPDSIINMAHYHHIKQDTTMNSCYPKGVDYGKVTYESRLLSIIDAYQALVGRRKYKKSWNPPAAIRYIDALAGVEFDMEAWENFLNVVGLFPKGSLVELNDRSIGFVMSTPRQDLKRPQVAIVRNPAGEDLTHHSLIDLEIEQDMSIINDLDIEETFGQDALNVFSNIRIV
ncbi:MAG: HD domain-containing protein [Proteobacteria bacterium]|nr:HD domain-containing protein [Pseudomonadota bacterium]